MLNISKQIYSGYGNKSALAVLPEAEIIPAGDSANEKKKLQKHAKSYINLKEHENVPLPGFTLFKSDRKTWNSMDQTWLVIDPRGFLVRISNKNLESILHVSGITEGLIQEKCVWAREDSQTRVELVPISSPLYIQAEENTRLLDSKVDMKDVAIGDTVITQSGVTGIFKGVLSLYGPVEHVSKSKDYNVATHPRRQIIEVSPGKYFYQTDTKILKITNKATVSRTREDSVKELNDAIAAGTSYFANCPSIMNRTYKYYGSHGIIKLASIHTTKPVVNIVEIDKADAIDLFTQATVNGDRFMLALRDKAGKYFTVDLPFSNHPGLTINNFNISEIIFLTIPNGIQISGKDERSFWHGPIENKFTTSIDSFDKFYKITKTVKTDSYT